MYISRLTAVRLGGVTDKTIELGPTLNIIYGENEAGKTTLRQALRLALYPISAQTPMTFGKTSPREASISIFDEGLTHSVTRFSKSALTSEAPSGSPEAQRVLDTLLGGLSSKDYQTVYNIGAEEIEALEANDVSALMAAEWGSQANPAKVLSNIAVVLNGYKGSGKKPDSVSITTGVSRIKAQLDRAHEVHIKYSAAQADYESIDKNNERLELLQDQSRKLRNTITQLTDDEAAMRQALQKLPELEDQLTSLKTVLSQTEQDIKVVTAQLNKELLSDELLVTDIVNRTDRQLQELNATLQHIKGQLSEAEAEYQHYSELPDFGSIANLQALIENLSRLDSRKTAAETVLAQAHNRFSAAEEQVSALESALQTLSESKPNNPKPSLYSRLLGSAVVFLGLSIITWLLSRDIWMSLLIGISGAGFVITAVIMATPKHSSSTETPAINELMTRIELAKSELASASNYLQNCQQTLHDADKEIEGYLAESGLDAHRDDNLPELIAQLKNADTQVRLRDSIQKYQSQINSKSNGLKELRASFTASITPYLTIPNDTLSLTALLELARSELAAQKILQSDASRLKSLNEATAEKHRLITAESETLKARVKSIAEHYPDLGLSENNSSDIMSLLSSSIAEKQEVLTEYEEEVGSLHTEIGRLQESIERTIGDTTLENAYSELSKLRAKLRKDVTDFAAYSIAHEILSQALAQYGSTKERDLLQIGSEILNDITSGEFVRVDIDSSKKELVCHRKDGQVVATDIMSTGTREQLFMALRFGVILSQTETGQHVPIVMDDTFAHSDYHRRQTAFKSIVRIANRTGKQILYFTCHRNMADELEATASEESLADYRRIHVTKG